MKKFLFVMAVFTALSLVSCSNEYKAKGEEFAKQLDELVQKQDTAGILALDQSIRDMENEIIANGDSASLAVFREALKDSRILIAPVITAVKLNQGAEKDEVIQEVAKDALQGGVDINAVTKSIDAALQQERQND